MTIDGSHGEGGGQIVRTGLALSAITGRAVTIENVRAGRSKPSLQPQHLAAVRAAASLCAARTDGERVGSTRLLFEPEAPAQPGAHRFDIGTAGAATLVAQTVLLPLASAAGSSRVTVTGGTHVPHAPPAEYLESVHLPMLCRAGLAVDLEAVRAGFFPQGGGELRLGINGPAVLRPLDLSERGRLVSLGAVIVTANLPEHVGARGERAVKLFMKGIGRRIETTVRPMASLSTGAAVVVVAACENGFGGFTALGERGKPIERVAEEACDAFLRWWKSGASVDERLCDQLVLPMALAPGESRWSAPRLTMHLHTVLWTARHFLPITYTLDERPDGSGAITLQGAGLR